LTASAPAKAQHRTHGSAQRQRCCRSASLPRRASLPLGVALLLAAVIGVVLVVIPGTGRIIQLRIVARRHCLGAQTAAAPAWPKDASSPAPNRDGK